MQIALLGDVMLGRLVNQHLATVRPAYPWGDTLELLRQADVRIANLECVLASGGEPEPVKVFHFRSDPKNVASLLAAGIDVVSLANNHVLDFGQDAFREMLPALDGRGILHAGAGLDLDAARRPAVRRVGSTAVGFIAFTDNEPGWEAGAATPGVYYVPVDDGGRGGGSGVDAAVWTGCWPWSGGRRSASSSSSCQPIGAAIGATTRPPGIRNSPGTSSRPEPTSCSATRRTSSAASGSTGTAPSSYSAGDFVDDYAVDPVERNDQSFVFMLETDVGTPRTLRLYPTIIAGFQARLARGSAPDIAARMQRLSGHLGTLSDWNASGRCLEIPLDKPAGV